MLVLDLITLLDAANMQPLVGVPPVATPINSAAGNVKWGSKSEIPDGPGPFLSLIDTGGMEAEGTHNSGVYDKPGVQIIGRAEYSEDAYAVAKAAHNVLKNLHNLTVNGRFYRHIVARQSPFDIGLDDNQRARYAFNIRTTGRS